MLTGVKTVLSKIDATGSVERCSGSGRPRAACSPDTISSVAAEQSELNPVDCAVWGILHVCVYKHHRITDMEDLRQRVEEEWDRLDQEVTDNAVSEWCKRLIACVAAGGGHFVPLSLTSLLMLLPHRLTLSTYHSHHP